MFLFYLCILISFIFFFLSILGLFRFPDVYTRLHSATLSTTFGSIFFTLSLLFFSLSSKISFVFPVHTIIVLLIILLVEPCLAHAISRAAYNKGIRPR